MIINSLGLSNLAPNPSPVTSFKDNDKIPGYARAPMYVADKIGLIQSDSKGYIYPTAKITKANAARMMEAYINYMNSGIREEYMEGIPRLLTYIRRNHIKWKKFRRITGLLLATDPYINGICIGIFCRGSKPQTEIICKV